jgi:TRAP-type C4-dicarboxylate transport system substrate-binding protein
MEENKERRDAMRRRLTFLFLVALFTFAVLSMVCGPVKAAETITLKAVTAWPKTATDNQAFFIFTELVEQIVAKRATGELKIQYIGGPEAVKTMDQVQAAQRGMVDMVFTTNAYYLSVLPEVDALKLSALTPMEERASGACAYLNSLHEQRLGLRYQARLGLDLKFHLYTSKPIKSADLKGLNIRVSANQLQAIKALGANPIVIPPTEVYAALERHVVDGYCWPSVGIRDWGWDKATKYVIDPGFFNVPNPVLINLKTWNNLSKKLQDILNEAGVEGEKKAVAHFADLAKKERPILEKEGIEVIELSPAEKEKFLKVAYDEGWKDILEKSPQTGAKLKDLLTIKR